MPPESFRPDPERSQHWRNRLEQILEYCSKTPGFLPFFGTSAAAPHAAGVAALVKSANPSLTGAQIRQILIDTALDNMAPGTDPDGGYGVVSAEAAVNKALTY